MSAAACAALLAPAGCASCGGRASSSREAPHLPDPPPRGPCSLLLPCPRSKLGSASRFALRGLLPLGPAAPRTRTRGARTRGGARAMAAESGLAPGKPRAARVMIVSDLDNTMVDHQDGNNERLGRFKAEWGAKYAADSLLVYSTGRSPFLYKELAAQKQLFTPDIVICSVGTEIMDGATLEPVRGWEELLDRGWDRAVVLEEALKFPALRLQRDSEQRPHKVSFNVEEKEAGPIVDQLSKRLADRGLTTKIIYSGGYDLDILPEAAGKGRATEYLLETLAAEGRRPMQTLVCGDSGNDIELYTVGGVNGVIVGNAMKELVEWHAQQPASKSEHIFRATERCAAGILQAMAHFKM